MGRLRLGGCDALRGSCGEPLQLAPAALRCTVRILTVKLALDTVRHDMQEAQTQVVHVRRATLLAIRREAHSGTGGAVAPLNQRAAW